MPQNFYELVWIFIIYAFIGWCTEVSYAALDTGKFVNRGFLNGPYCPIYGCGVVIVVAILTPLQDNLVILFIGSILLTTALEFVTGYILEKVFHNKWWDYSDKPFNVKGYICLKFSIYWGLACTFIMKIVHPAIYKTITWIPFIPGIVILSIFMCVFIVDCCITVSTILKFNKRLKLMDEMAASIRKLSDEIGENIYENVSGVIEKSEEFQENHAELIDKLTESKEKLADATEAAKEKIADARETTREKLADAKDDIMELPGATREKLADATEAAKEKLADATEATREKIADTLEEKKRQYAELSEKYEKLFEEKSFGFKRLMQAFPDMKSTDNDETLQKFKLHFHIINNIRKRDEEKND